eukprot:TRINITY_DN5140_c0_g1_i2.p1 TRINITY_DN5140_c0_g1~~TRINITY_DN5140_c0_g1_i2.p1  ORF type:complete len:240 (+),score=39.56 TRINITY_DN5140_c0_g1_i2:670-1389(+)
MVDRRKKDRSPKTKVARPSIASFVATAKKQISATPTRFLMGPKRSPNQLTTPKRKLRNYYLGNSSSSHGSRRRQENEDERSSVITVNSGRSRSPMSGRSRELSREGTPPPRKRVKSRELLPVVEEVSEESRTTTLRAPQLSQYNSARSKHPSTLIARGDTGMRNRNSTQQVIVIDAEASQEKPPRTPTRTRTKNPTAIIIEDEGPSRTDVCAEEERLKVWSSLKAVSYTHLTLPTIYSV